MSTEYNDGYNDGANDGYSQGVRDGSPSAESCGIEAAAKDPKQRCDHICLLTDDHVQRGEPHFYGYELPSPRLSADKAIVAAAKAWGAANRNRADAFPTPKLLDAQDAERQARDALFALVDPGEES